MGQKLKECVHDFESVKTKSTLFKGMRCGGINYNQIPVYDEIETFHLFCKKCGLIKRFNYIEEEEI